MFKRARQAFNPKRQIRDVESASALVRALRERGTQPTYGGNPVHKRNPADFGLHPPSSPRPDKTLCDGIVDSREQAQRLLELGFGKGLVSVQERDGWPQNVWAVAGQRDAVEAQHEGSGRYHGYPMPVSDPFAMRS